MTFSTRPLPKVEIFKAWNSLNSIKVVVSKRKEPNKMSIFARLSVIQGPDKGKELRFSSGIIRIGRFKDSDLVISDNDMGVSGKHFEVRFKRDKYYLYDYSKNGTFVKGKEVREGILEDGDQIGIGFSTVIQFRLEGVTECGIKTNHDDSL
jgi:pSer/pThr/pTyr-binding forkhead associated (FHA) protein